MQSDTFYFEVSAIQKRNAAAFPVSQFKYIKIIQTNKIHKLKFLKGYNLSTVIGTEIEKAFNLIYLGT